LFIHANLLGSRHERFLRDGGVLSQRLTDQNSQRIVLTLARNVIGIVKTIGNLLRLKVNVLLTGSTRGHILLFTLLDRRLNGIGQFRSRFRFDAHTKGLLDRSLTIEILAKGTLFLNELLKVGAISGVLLFPNTLLPDESFSQSVNSPVQPVNPLGFSVKRLNEKLGSCLGFLSDSVLSTIRFESLLKFRTNSSGFVKLRIRSLLGHANPNE